MPICETCDPKFTIAPAETPKFCFGTTDFVLLKKNQKRQKVAEKIKD